MDYNDKLKLAKEALESGSYDRETIEYIFPELKESEDERIRKHLIKHFRNKSKEDWNGVPVKSILAWLEKQGKQPNKISMWKHWKDGIAGNGEGKQVYLIKNGTNYNISSCLGYECDYIELSELDNILSQENQKPTNKVEPKFKVGDVIVEIKPNGYCPPIKVKYVGEGGYSCESEDGKRYLFFPIINQDEYKLVEQKPAWSEEDEHCIELLLPIIDSSSLILKNREKCKKFLKSIKDRVQPIVEWKHENTGDLTDFENAMMHIGEFFFGKNAGLNPNDTNTIKEQANILSELVQRKEWSEEDERCENTLLWIIESFRKNGFNETHKQDANKSEKWLKSLKDRIKVE